MTRFSLSITGLPPLDYVCQVVGLGALIVSVCVIVAVGPGFVAWVAGWFV